MCDNDLFLDTENYTLQDIKLRLRQLEDSEALLKLPAIVFIGILLLIGLLGNALVCVVYSLKFPASTSKYFILTLAIFDLLNCTIAIPAEIADLRFDYHFNSPEVCRVMRFTITFSTSASAGILLAIATDRFRKICHPLEKQMNLWQTKLAICMAICGAITVSWPITLLYGRSTRVIKGVRVADCALDDTVRNSVYPQLYTAILTTICLISIIALIVLYTLIVLRVWKQKQLRARFQSPVTNRKKQTCTLNKLNCFENSDDKNGSADSEMFGFEQNKTAEKRKSNSSQNQSVRTTLMLLLVTTVFIISFIPYFALQILKNAVTDFDKNLHCNHVAMVTYKFFLRSVYINSAANPIIYSFCNIHFRTECRDFLRRLCCSTACDSKQTESNEPINNVPEPLDQQQQQQNLHTGDNVINGDADRYRVIL